MVKKFLLVLLCLSVFLLSVGCGISGAAPKNPAEEAVKLGEGENTFNFSVVDADGNEALFEISTDRQIVGEALQALGLLQGEQGPFGLYVKTVNGITVDFDADGKYWAFYVNGEYAMQGVDATEIENGKTYTFKVEK